MASIMRLMRPLRQCRYMRPAVTSFARPAPIIAAHNRRFNSTDATENTKATTEAITEAHDSIEATTELIAEATEATQRHKITETTESTEHTRGTDETVKNARPKSKYSRGWATEAQHRLRNITWRRARYNGRLPEDVEAQFKALNQFFGSYWLSMIAGREGFINRGAFDKQSVAYGDMDISVTDTLNALVCRLTNTQGRVNAAALSRYAETSRMNWFTWFMNHDPPKKFWEKILKPSNVEMLLTRQALEFKHAITFPDRLTVMHKMAVRPDETKTQISLQAVVFSGEQRRVVARVNEQLLYIQKDQQRQSAPLPKEARATLIKWWDQQAKTSLEAEKTIDTFHGMLDKLEADLPEDFWEKKADLKEEASQQDGPKEYILPDLE